MRAIDEVDQVTLKAYAGTTGVLLAMNMPPSKRAGLLGFAISRRRPGENEPHLLLNRLHFHGRPHETPMGTPSDKAPIQSFRWSDYTVRAGQTYDYSVQPVFGTPDDPVPEPGPSVQVRTASITSGEHRVSFSRAATASQAFSTQFPDVEIALEAERRAAKLEGRPMSFQLPPAALRWLTRDVLPQILDFVERASGPEWGLDIAIYEYVLPEIISAVEAAVARGAQVRIVYHAKPGDEATLENEHSVANLPPAVKRGRIPSNIFHHKFMVLSRIEGGVRQPASVLCGSTNFTHNGVYRQANVVHVAEVDGIAAQYLALFEGLFQGDPWQGTRTYINTNNAFGQPQPFFVGFSPRSSLHDITAFVNEVRAAQRDVLFCTTFQLTRPIEEALLGAPGDPILRYGLQNTSSDITGFQADRAADFTATALLSKGLEGFLKESLAGQRGRTLVHTKLIIVDFTSDAPVVISGSHNFSVNASKGNDENYMIIRGNIDVADSYGCELMRLYDHYRFRYYSSKNKRSDNKPLELTQDNSWSDKYFTTPPSLKSIDRQRFAGEPV